MEGVGCKSLGGAHSSKTAKSPCQEELEVSQVVGKKSGTVAAGWKKERNLR